MREVKFRYKYTDGQDWIMKPFTLEEIINGDPFEVISDNPLLKRYTMVEWDELAMKDYDGKEIYEGDIVCVEKVFGGPVNAEVSYNEKDGCWILLSPSFQRSITNYKRLTRKIVIDHFIRVIGNIYENKTPLSV